MNAKNSALTAVRSSSLAQAWNTSISGSCENSDGSSNGRKVDLVMVVYPLSEIDSALNTAMISHLLHAITNFQI